MFAKKVLMTSVAVEVLDEIDFKMIDPGIEHRGFEYLTIFPVTTTLVIPFSRKEDIIRKLKMHDWVLKVEGVFTERGIYQQGFPVMRLST